MNRHEELLVNSFIENPRRPRYLLELGSRKRRARALDRLNHMKDLDERYVTWLPRSMDALSILRSEGAPRTCHVIGGDDSTDGREMDLAEALKRVQEIGWGTLVGCIPGKLAYYHDECGERQALLRREFH